MIRMEVACFVVVAFMAILYFSAKREKTSLHRCFSILLIVSMVHLVFDGVTIYTVNNLNTIPIWLNDIFHRIFIGTMTIVFYLIYCYVKLLICAETDTYKRGRTPINITSLVLVLLGVLFLPIEYVQTEKGNYSYGPAAYMAYVGVGLYLFLVIFLMIKYRKQVHPKKKMAVSIAIGIEFVVSAYQALNPLSLVSGMGIMLLNLSFYLTLENPDIVLVQQVQKEKEKADEANAAKSTFLSHMSHEIRTPMNAIVGMSEILLRTDMSEEQKEYLANIRSSGNALVAIINDILDISKIEAGKMELVEDIYDIRAMISDIRMIIQNRIGDKPIEYLFEIDEELPDKLYGDGLRIRQVIINLLNNAVKFTDQGYVKLCITTKFLSEDEISMHVSVSDTGQGIRQEDLQKLFEAFRQVDVKKNRGKEGTGLGLSISGQLIEMMGGKLEVQSTYQVGSEFFFTIKQKLVAAEIAEETHRNVTNFTAPKARILIVDDSSINLKVATGLLEPLQMQMDVAENGKKALAMIREQKYHLVFMDHMMPVMDGIEATKELRSMEGDYYRDLPIIALSANAVQDAQKLFLESGMNGFVAKPIDMKQVCTVLLKWLPKELIVIQEDVDEALKDAEKVRKFEQTNLVKIEGIDEKEGIRNTGNTKLWMNLMGDFYKLIDQKAVKIEKCVADNLIKDYTIEVHALKNTARMIGAMELSNQFSQLEQYGNAGDKEAIHNKTPEVLVFFRRYKEILKPYGKMQDANKREASNDEIIQYLQGIQEAIEAFDLDVADEAMKNLEECYLPGECMALMDELRAYMADVAMENILCITQEMMTLLKQT
ncbi:MAG: response regulator [Lachnospiraceae bacterium]|nr:response regulator [Lachnospiraceae bacterium]